MTIRDWIRQAVRLRDGGPRGRFSPRSHTASKQMGHSVLSIHPAPHKRRRGRAYFGHTAKIGIRGNPLRDRNRLMPRNFLARPERLELPTYWFEAGEARGISSLHG